MYLHNAHGDPLTNVDTLEVTVGVPLIDRLTRWIRKSLGKEILDVVLALYVAVVANVLLFLRTIIEPSKLMA
jgi:hypothetical protein